MRSLRRAPPSNSTCWTCRSCDSRRRNGLAMDQGLSAADKLATRAKALELIKKLSYREGDFVLASGKKSRFYLDMKPTMFHPDGAHSLAGLVLDKLSSLNVDCIGGLAVGAIPLTVAVSLRSA